MKPNKPACDYCGNGVPGVGVNNTQGHFCSHACCNASLAPRRKYVPSREVERVLNEIASGYVTVPDMKRLAQHG